MAAWRVYKVGDQTLRTDVGTDGCCASSRDQDGTIVIKQSQKA